MLRNFLPPCSLISCDIPFSGQVLSSYLDMKLECSGPLRYRDGFLFGTPAPNLCFKKRLVLVP